MKRSQYFTALIATLTIVGAVPLTSQVTTTAETTTTGAPPPPPPSGCGKCDCTDCTEKPKPPKPTESEHADLGSPNGNSEYVGMALLQKKGLATQVTVEANVPRRQTYSVYVVDSTTYKIKAEKKVTGRSGKINAVVTTTDSNTPMVIVSPKSNLTSIKSTDVTMSTKKP